jgi:hypothetical protein
MSPILDSFGYLEDPYLSNLNHHRYFLINKPLKESLLEAMREAYSDRDRNDADRDFIRNFRKEHNWIHLAERLIELVSP